MYLSQPHDLQEVGASLFRHDPRMPTTTHTTTSGTTTTTHTTATDTPRGGVVAVGAVSLSRFLLEAVARRPGRSLSPRSRTVVKLDAEGAEYALLPQVTTH